MRKTVITTFHNKAPRKLIQLYKQNSKSCYRVGKKIGVNPAHVWNLLKNGVEPKREDLRRKLFFSHKKTLEELQKQKEERKKKYEALPEYVKQFRKLPKEERYKVFQQYMKWKDKL